MGATGALAQLAVQVSNSDIGPLARQVAKRTILDTIGAGLAGWREPGIPEAVDQVRHWGGREDATLLTYGGALPAPNAAFANSCMVHALDYDDTHMDSGLHIMSSVLPVSLAVAEMRRGRGLDLLGAVVVGVEVAARIGILARKGKMDRGFLPASTIGGFGATAAACRLLRLSVDQTKNALGIFYAQTSGNRQALMDHSLTKRMQPAYAARSALWAALLAERGVTGATRAIEGNEGFFRVYVRADPPDESEVAGLRGNFEIERIWVKPYPSCGANHLATQAAIELAIREDLRPEAIEAVDVAVGERVLWIVGAPFELGANPQVNAQFSLTYSVAAGLVHRAAGLRQYSAESVVSDKTVHAVVRKTRLHEIEGSRGKFVDEVPAIVTVATRDWRTLSNTAHVCKGSPANPMSYAVVAAKFRECADYAGHWPAERVEELIALVENLEALPDIAELVRSKLTIDTLAAN